MGLFFGTDGLRGKVNEDLTYQTAYKVGNALSILKQNPKIIIGADTRISNSYLTLGVALGAMSGGANVTDIGVCPTAGIAYLAKELKADYGVVISASHNSGEYNGIKVFNGEGYKLGDKEEEYNKAFGGYAAKNCDYICLVGRKRAEPIATGAREAGFPEEKLRIFDRLQEALDFAYMVGDEGHKFILLENDLPDNY